MGTDLETILDLINDEEIKVENHTEDNERFYLWIGDWMGGEEHWFKTEKELNDYLNGIDTTGLRVFAVEVNKVIYNM